MSAVAGRSFHVTTFGCQMNEYDSEVIAASLEALGCFPVESHEAADIVVFNTCCVRENADVKVYGRLGELKGYRQRNPRGMVVVAGCLAQKDAEDMRRRFPQVDIVLGTHNLKTLPDAVESVAVTGQPEIRLRWGGVDLELSTSRRGLISASVPITMGCDEFCTFCIVPFVRGRLKSRPLENVVKEVQHLAEHGYREVLLLGQNVNSYGFDLTPLVDFGDLLVALQDVPHLDRIRFTSPHPKDFSQKVLNAIRDVPSVVEHVHLPLQSGDDEVLRRMRRPYNRQEYLALVERIRATIPGVGITTDIIVGFPTETDAQFENTLALVRQARFESAYMFAYSARQGTAAARLEDEVGETVRSQRLHRLIDTQNAITLEKNLAQVGDTVELLIEGPSKRDPNRLTGRTRTHKLCHFAGQPDMIGTIQHARITEAYVWGFQGEHVPQRVPVAS